MKAFLDALRETPLLFDGAMGSLLYERGIFLTRSYDELNLSQPELITQAHRDYVDAGVDIIETNTFAANFIALAKHGHSSKTTDINTAAAKIARQAAKGHNVYVAGAIGPTGIAYDHAPDAEQAQAKQALAQQIKVLADAQVDLIVLETFYYVREIEAAILAAKAHDLPIVAQVVFSAKGTTKSGLGPREVAQRLILAGADVIGANCGTSPPELFEVGTQMLEVAQDVPVSIQPNAGLPSTVEGRTIYIANPEHFGVFSRRLLQAGVSLVGGCCGTTPEHTRRMLGSVRMIGARPLPTRTRGGQSVVHAAKAPGTEPVPFAERSVFAKKLAEGKFVVSCELTAPSGTSAEHFVAIAKKLAEAGIDAINIADGPRATARMGNIALCTAVQRDASIETILHVCCRDRNLLGLISHLLGAHSLGLRNLVLITGDPPKMGDYPFATPVYDLDSVGLLRVAADLNRGVDPGGKAISGQTSFVLATGAEPGALDYDRELDRLEKKKAAGAELVMTQPVYDAKLIDRFLTDTKSVGLPIMIGLLPLASSRNADFLHNNVPGMQIPEDIRARMAKAGGGKDAQKEGIRIAKEALAAIKDRVQGAYIMPPFNRVASVLAVIEDL